MQREGDILELSPMLVVFQLVINITLQLTTFSPQPCKSCPCVYAMSLMCFNSFCSLYNVAEGFNPDDFVLPTFCFE